ncbi:MAG: hypothetical protein NUV73_01835, partial [Candidatus Daviesbacteria bacterium]|nr:hypothetical protein [Candidatus Daviesbacteria bacterium]
IDTEYSGHERQIKSFILQIFRMEDYKEPIISFTQVGKKSSAHLGAYAALIHKVAKIKVTASEVLRYYEKTNKS